MAIKCPKCHYENPGDTIYCGKCAFPLKSSDDIGATKTLETPKDEIATQSIFADRYQIIEKLGKGGMGSVFKVFDREIEEEVALKLLNPEIAADGKTVKRFRNELKLARMITHKNVCRTFDIGKEKETLFITMEYVDGQDLKNLIQSSGKFKENKAVSIAKQVCEGLAEAHDLGVIHRDLKTRNIMVDKNGNAKILDFGIARKEEAKEVTEEGIIVGTPDYMSPEQIEGKKVDSRSDIYSVGIILYEMVTGQVPFAGDTWLNVAVKHKTEVPPDPRKFNDQLSKGLRNVILKCLEKNKKDRYQKAEELISNLERIQKSIPFAEPIDETPAREMTTEAERKNSIAILPFADLSPGKDQEYFCDGMAEELINSLTQIKNFHVVARTSAFFFKGKDSDIREIGKKLNVEAILEGSVRKAGNRLRITAQLINVEDGYHLWSERYDREMDDVFAIQDDVTLSIVDKLKIKLLSGDKTRLLKRSTDNMDAYHLYLKGLYFFNKRSKEGMEKGIEYFQKAIDIDPDYAAAYVGLVESFIQLGFWGFLSPKESISKAKTLAEKALRLDDSIADVHTALGWINVLYDWDWENAEKRIKLALKLNPGYAVAYNRHCTYLTAVRKIDEAITAMRKAVELDPLSVRLNSELALYYHLSGRWEESMGQIQKTLEMDPHYGNAYWIKGLALGLKNEFKEAVSALKKAVQLTGGSTTISGHLGYYYAKSGEEAKAKTLIQKLEARSKKHYVSSTYTSIGLTYFGLGDHDKFFEYWEKAYKERDLNLVLVHIFPEFRGPLSDPRFKDLLKRMGIEINAEDIKENNR
ncbi:MAG: protein kinase [Candidatus Aminicenantes bacterium]|nr:MAG: protein kinase [Candidatus Aminicenantes bacterium]